MSPSLRALRRTTCIGDTTGEEGNTGGNGGDGGAILSKRNVRPAPGPHNYNKVLRKAILFYEAQCTGRLPATNRIKWRKSGTVRDGAAGGVELSGDWYDARDFVKFGLPMAYSVTVLALT